MQISEIRTKNFYRSNLNAKIVTVTTLNSATVEFECDGAKQVPMLKTLFAKNFSLFS
jgi:hypothetical protein